MTWELIEGDCIQCMAALPEASVDLVFGSPPYMDARTYGIDAQRGCAAWVNWMLAVSQAAVRVSKGLVLWVVAGVQRDNVYWPGCEGLAWEWWKHGGSLWRPCVWWKVDANDNGTGIPGSGGKQWLRADWEYVLCFKRPDWLPWADNTAMGHEPICDKVGGAMSNRTEDGRRINAGTSVGVDVWRTGQQAGIGGRRKDGSKKTRSARKPQMDVTAGHDADGITSRANGRPLPKIANPGNVLRIDEGLIVKARVGGGHIGSPLAHEGEAPFPEKLAAFFIRSFCPPGGKVLDPFSGSGTTVAVAHQLGRQGTGIDIRPSQIALGTRRCQGVTPDLFTTEAS